MDPDTLARRFRILRWVIETYTDALQHQTLSQEDRAQLRQYIYECELWLVELRRHVVT